MLRITLTPLLERKKNQKIVRAKLTLLKSIGVKLSGKGATFAAGKLWGCKDLLQTTSFVNISNGARRLRKNPGEGKGVKRTN